jgi:hypothetical protein
LDACDRLAEVLICKRSVLVQLGGFDGKLAPSDYAEVR